MATDEQDDNTETSETPVSETTDSSASEQPSPVMMAQADTGPARLLQPGEQMPQNYIQSPTLPQMPGQPGQPAPHPLDAHPAVQKASVIRRVAETIAGGPQEKVTIDPNTGVTTREKVPLSRGQIMMGILANVLGGVGHIASNQSARMQGRATQPGFTLPTEVAKQREEQKTKEDFDRQQKAIVQQAQVFSANTMAVKNIAQAEKLGVDTVNGYVKNFNTIYADAEVQGSIVAGTREHPIAQEDAIDGMKSGKYNAGEDMFVPTGSHVSPNHTNIQIDGVIIKDRPFDLRRHSDAMMDDPDKPGSQIPNLTPFPLDKAVQYGFLPKGATAPGATIRTSTASQLAQKVSMVDMARKEFDDVHNKLGTDKDEMPSFDEAIKTPGTAEALYRLQSHLIKRSGTVSYAEAISDMLTSTKNPKTGQTEPNTEERYGRLALQAFGGPDVLAKLQADKPQKPMDHTAAISALSDPNTPKDVAAKATQVLKLERQEKAKSAADTARETEKVKREATDPEVESLAQGLLDPTNLTTLSGVASLRNDMRARVYDRMKELDPNANPGLIDRRVKFLDSYQDPKGRASINRQAINNIAQHASDLADINQGYRRTDVKLLNTPINKLKEQASPAYTRFETVSGVLNDELSLYFAGGYAPTKDQQDTWTKIQNGDATMAQTEEFAKEILRLASRRASTFNSQFEGIMGYDDPNLISPDAREASRKLLGNDPKSNPLLTFGSGGQMAKPKAAPTSVSGQLPAVQPGFVRFKDSQGGMHDIPQANLKAAQQRDPGLQVIK